MYNPLRNSKLPKEEFVMVSGIRRARFIRAAPVFLAEVNQNVILLCSETVGSIHSLRAPAMLHG